MNWYKKSQQLNITYNDIVGAIDRIIAREGLITVQDIDEAQNYIKSGQYSSKAAQVINKEVTKKVIDLFEKGWADLHISREVGLSALEIKRILINNYGSIEKAKANKGILLTPDVESIVGRQDDSQLAPTMNSIAKELKTTKSIIKGIIQKLNISIIDLARQRRKRIAVILVRIVDGYIDNGLDYGPKIIEKEFKEEQGYSISRNAILLALSRHDRYISSLDTVVPMLRAIEYAFVHQKGMSISDYIKSRKREDKEGVISNIIDEFISQYGTNYGYDVSKPMGRAKMREFIMKKLQIRDLLAKYQPNTGYESRQKRRQQRQNFQFDLGEEHPTSFTAEQLMREPESELV